MRRVIGSILAIVAGYLLYKFALWGAFLAPAGAWRGPSTPFRTLGGNYPTDVAMLCAAAWAAGLGLYFILSPGRSAAFVTPSHVPSTSRWAQRMAAQGGASTPMAATFLLNALLLATTLFVAFFGVKSAGDASRYIATFTLVAWAQVAVGLILMILALFEKPKGVVGLVLGGAVYLAGTALGVMVFLWGQPVQS
jgi:hypothetical protein